MRILAFILECAAIAAFIGSAASLLATIVWITSRPIFLRLSASARADLAFVVASLPAIVTLAGTVAAAGPPILGALGVVEDHCPTHSHHLHLCIIHSTGLRVELAAAGALALAMGLLRSCLLLKTVLKTRRDVGELERLGARSCLRSPVIELPGAPRFCHAVGYFRGRILLSATLAARLRRDHLDCALAHESAHLRRRDPLNHLLLSIASLFHPPFVFGALRRAYATAAEEACDDDAVSSIGDPSRVAEALVAVAALQQGPSGHDGLAHAFGEHALERRVRRLLTGRSVKTRRARALCFGAAASAGIALLAVSHAPTVHHAVETFLHRFF